MYTYRLPKEGTGVLRKTISTNQESYIPTDVKNIDYQLYLEWKDDGNTPSAYEE